MILWFWFVKAWTNKVGRYVILAVAAAVLVASVLGYWYAKGKRAGELKADISQAEVTAKDLERTRESAAIGVKVANEREAAAKREAQAAGARARQAEARARAAEQKLQAAAAEVAKTPTPDVHAAIKYKLGAPDDKVLEAFTADEERVLLLAIAQNEAYFSQLTEFKTAVDELGRQVEALKAAQDAAAERERKVQEYVAKLEPAYVQAYNALLKQKRRSPWTIFCLRLCGKPRQLELPDVDALRGPP